MRTARGCGAGIAAPSTSGELCAGCGSLRADGRPRERRCGRAARPEVRRGPGGGPRPGLAFPGCSGSDAAPLRERCRCPGVRGLGFFFPPLRLNQKRKKRAGDGAGKAVDVETGGNGRSARLDPAALGARNGRVGAGRSAQRRRPDPFTLHQPVLSSLLPLPSVSRSFFPVVRRDPLTCNGTTDVGVLTPPVVAKLEPQITSGSQDCEADRKDAR